jgi:hypothetical protein
LGELAGQYLKERPAGVGGRTDPDSDLGRPTVRRNTRTEIVADNVQFGARGTGGRTIRIRTPATGGESSKETAPAEVAERGRREDRLSK